MNPTPVTHIIFLLVLWISVIGAGVYAMIMLPHRPVPLTEVAQQSHESRVPAEADNEGTKGLPAAAPASEPASDPVRAAAEALKTLGTQIAPQAERTGRSPTFDIARIEPGGDSVIAGRASPGASVELLRGAEVHDRTIAGPSGEFVFTPKPLPPGSYDLTLQATEPDGSKSTSKDVVAVELGSGKKQEPVMAPVAPDKPTIALSNPAGDAPTRLTIDTVESETSGRLSVSGRAAPGANVRLYLNDAYIASATASAEGRLAFVIQGGVSPGAYRVRLDQVEPSGSVQSRAEVPFSTPMKVAAPASPAPPPDPETTSSAPPAKTTAPPAAPLSVVSAPQPNPAESTPASGDNASKSDEKSPSFRPAAPQPSSPPTVLSAAPDNRNDVVVVPNIDTTTVARGDNLWRISQTAYGQGKRYPVIYDANRKQIRDPDLIYPGQIFVLPKALPTR